MNNIQIQHGVCVCVCLCVWAWLCVCLPEALWVGEPGSAGTHSCFMGLFQEELLDLFMFTCSQFVWARVCVCVCVCMRLCSDVQGWVLVLQGWVTDDLFIRSDTPLLWPGSNNNVHAAPYLQKDRKWCQLVVTHTTVFRSHTADT